MTETSKMKKIIDEDQLIKPAKENAILLRGPGQKGNTDINEPKKCSDSNNEEVTRKQLVDGIEKAMVDVGQGLGDLHRILLPKERQLFKKKEEHALEVSKYFSDFKMKVNKYLLEQEEKIQENLLQLTEKEAKQITDDVSKCTNLLESLDQTESKVKQSKSDNAITLTDLQRIKQTLSENSEAFESLKQRADTPFEVRFIINTDLEDMFTECNIVTIETIKARHMSTNSRPESVSEDTQSLGVSDDIGYADSESDDESISEPDTPSTSSASSDERDSSDNEDEHSENTFSDITQSNQETRERVANVRREESVEATTPSSGPTTPVVTTTHYADEPPPPYPGLPEQTAPVYTTPRTNDGRSPNDLLSPSNETSSSRPGGNTHSRSRSADFGRDNTARGMYPDHRNSPPGSASGSRGAGAESHRSRSLRASDLEKGEKPLYPTMDDSAVHPELRVPRPAHSSPTAPPMPVTAFDSRLPNFRRSDRRSPDQRHHREQRPGSARMTSQSGRYSPQQSSRNSSQSSGDHYSFDGRRSHPHRYDHHHHHHHPRSVASRSRSAPFSFKFMWRSNTAIGEDEKPPQLVGLAYLAETYSVVIDFSNCKLKLMKNKSVVGVLLFGSYEPWDVATVSDTKCAVTVPKAREICFVSRQGLKLKLGKRVPTARGYCSIAHPRYEDYFICGCSVQFGNPHVALVSFEGEVLKLINKSSVQDVLFSNPCAITVTEDSTFVVVDRDKKKVVFMEFDGTVITSFQQSETKKLENIQGAAAMRYQRLVLVSDSKTNDFHIFTNTGTYRGCVSGGENLVCPRNITVTPSQKPQLLVAHGNGYVSIFDFTWGSGSRS